MNLVRVATPAAPDFTAHWSIVHGLTDRWGELNDACMDVAAYHQLVKDEALTRRLVEQMWDEATFVAQKDGFLGVLFEGEFVCLESDAKSGEFPVSELRPYADVLAEILERIPSLEAAFPGVHFCAPERQEMFDMRAGLWAFVPDGVITDPHTRDRLGHAVLSAGVLEPEREAA